MQTEKDQVHVLLIEDDEEDFLITRTLLGRATGMACELTWTRTYDEGLEALLAETYDVCLVDYRLGPHSGLDLLREALDQGCHTPIILLTGQGALEVDLRAMSMGAADYLIKGEIHAPMLERSIRYARERARAEERIRAQATLLDKARDAICACDLDGRIVYWNKSAADLTDREQDEALGQLLSSFWYAHDDYALEAAWETVLREGEWSGELRSESPDRHDTIIESRWTLVRDAAGQPSSVLVINTDITERKRLEEQFLRAQRMESIGRLVGGIAHDLGNLLVPILLGVKVLGPHLEDNEKAQRTLAMMQKSAERGSSMVRQVLAFARGVEGERAALDMSHLVHETEKILRETLPSSITLAIQTEDDLPTVTGDATQIQQVLMNLCVNARDAMPDGGVLTVETHSATVGPSAARVQFDAQPGDYVRLRVADTGEGISRNVLDKIFEPFFTTKSVGKGTGLGLSTVYSIVKSHGGFITVDSAEGQGTRFDVYLPASSKPSVAMPQEDGEETCQGQGELVIVVDDEEYVLETTASILEGYGFRVLPAGDGLEALSLLRRYQGEVDLLLTDIMMPELDGVALIRAVRAQHGSLPIIAVSGVTGETSREALDVGANVFLPKPFSPSRLCAAMTQLLDLSPASEVGSRESV